MDSDDAIRDDDRTADHDRTTADSPATVPSNAESSADGSSREGGAGEAIGRSFDSARDTLAQPGPKSQLAFAIGLFGVIGIGFGLLGIIVLELLAGGDSGMGGAFVAALFLISLLVVVLLTGPLVAALSGLRIAERLEESTATYLTSFVATAVGYVVMVVVAALLIGLVAGGGGGAEATATDSTTTNPFGLADLLVPLIVLAIPVGLTGVGSAFLERWNATR